MGGECHPRITTRHPRPDRGSMLIVLEFFVVEFIIDFDVFFFFVVDFCFGHFSHVGTFDIGGRGHFRVHIRLRVAAKNLFFDMIEPSI